MAALRIHQHGVDQMRIALPLPPLPLRAARQIERVAALQHHALDRLGIFAGAGAGGIFSRRGQRVPALEGNRRRQIDPGIAEFCDERLQPLAAFLERQLAQIVFVFAEQIIGAQMDRIFLRQFRRDHFPVQALLQHVESLHPAVAQHQQFAVDGAGQVQRRQQVRKAFGDVLAAARIKPRLMWPRASRPLTACTRMPSHFHSAMKSAASDWQNPHPRSHAPASPGGTAWVEIDRLLGCGLPAMRTGRDRAARARPHQFEFVRVLVAERRGGGLGQPRRNPDPHRAGDEFQQRPAAGLVEFVEPARQLFRQFGLAERAQRGDDFGEGGRGRVVVAGAAARPSATSAPPSPRDRRHSHRTGRTAPDRCDR